jgi:hypothetical protein
MALYIVEEGADGMQFVVDLSPEPTAFGELFRTDLPEDYFESGLGVFLTAVGFGLV